MEIEVTVPRRQAFLSVHIWYPWQDATACQDSESSRIPVLVWPMPDTDGRFVVEHKNGTCSKAWPHELTFLDSKELFDSYCWDIPPIEIGCV